MGISAVLTGLPRSSSLLPLPHSLLCFQQQEAEHHLSQHPCQRSSECAATGNCKITLPKMDSAYSAVWRRKKTPAAQLLALTLFTYCCTQGIYIYSTTRNRCWVIEKLEPSIVLLSCHHREICFNLL